MEMHRWDKIIADAKLGAAKVGITNDDARGVLAFSVGALAQQVIILEDEVARLRLRYQEEMDANRETEKVEVE